MNAAFGAENHHFLQSKRERGKLGGSVRPTDKTSHGPFSFHEPETKRGDMAEWFASSTHESDGFAMARSIDRISSVRPFILLPSCSLGPTCLRHQLKMKMFYEPGALAPYRNCRDFLSHMYHIPYLKSLKREGAKPKLK